MQLGCFLCPLCKFVDGSFWFAAIIIEIFLFTDFCQQLHEERFIEVQHSLILSGFIVQKGTRI